jgi:hypothetical protein
MKWVPGLATLKGHNPIGEMSRGNIAKNSPTTSKNEKKMTGC